MTFLVLLQAQETPPPVAALSGSGVLTETLVSYTSGVDLSGEGAGASALVSVGAEVPFGGTGALVVAGERNVVAETGLMVLDPVISQAPTTLTVALTGGLPETNVVFRIDGVVVYTATTDSNGALAPTSIPVPESVGAGTHTVTATQGGATASSGTFTMQRDPNPTPIVRGPDAQPVEIPEAQVGPVRRWVLQDLMPDGLGSYVLPANPSTMSNPHFERGLSAMRSTAALGQFHVFEEGPAPVEWSFSGYCPTQEMHDRLVAFGNLNRRFYVIDHRGRAWKVTFLEVDMVARLRQVGVEGVLTDWGHDYTITAIVYDQDAAVPA